MEFDSREAQDLNLENEKKYIFYSLVLWVSIALGLSICILLKFLAFFLCLLFFCVEGRGLYLQSKSQWQRQSQSQSLGIWSWHNNFCHTIEVFANANRKSQTANGKWQTATAIALRRQSVKRKAVWKGVSCVSSPTWYPIAMPYRGSYGIANELSSSMAMGEVSLKLGRI